MQFIRDDFGDVQMVADDDPRVAAFANPNDVSAQIAARLAQQGYYQSPEGWGVVTGSADGQSGGAPRIVLDRTGKQPPADILAKYPMASAQEQQGYSQANAQYDAQNAGGEGADIRNALLTAAGSYFGGQALGNLAGGSSFSDLLSTVGAEAGGDAAVYTAADTLPAGGMAATGTPGLTVSTVADEAAAGGGAAAGGAGGTGLPSWLTPSTALSGAGLGLTLAGGGSGSGSGGGSGSTNMTGFTGNAPTFSAPPDFNLGSGAAGTVAGADGSYSGLPNTGANVGGSIYDLAGVPNPGTDTGWGSNLPGMSGASGGQIAPGSTGGAPGAASTSSGGWTDFLKGLMPSGGMGSLLPLGLFGASMLAKPKAPDLSELNRIAGDLSGPGSTQSVLDSEAKSLIPSVSTGQLPPGADALVSNALQDAHTSIKSKYASLGLAGSTMEMQELSAAESRAAGQRFEMASSLTNTGITEAGLSASDLGASAQIYESIMKTQMEQDSALQAALANFAGQMAIGQGLAARGATGTAAKATGGAVPGVTVPAGGFTDGLGNVFDSKGQLVKAAPTAAVPDAGGMGAGADEFGNFDTGAMGDGSTSGGGYNFDEFGNLNQGTDEFASLLGSL